MGPLRGNAADVGLVDPLKRYWFERIRNSVEDNASTCQGDNSICERASEIDLMQADDSGEPILATYLAQQSQDGLRSSGIEAGDWLVSKNQVGLLHQSARNSDALLLPPDSSSARRKAKSIRPTRSIATSAFSRSFFGNGRIVRQLG